MDHSVGIGNLTFQRAVQWLRTELSLDIGIKVDFEN